MTIINVGFGNKQILKFPGKVNQIVQISMQNADEYKGSFDNRNQGVPLKLHEFKEKSLSLAY